MHAHVCSRCTGYRPILDAFSVFAKADPLAYTEEAIAASKAGSCSADSTDSSSRELEEDGHATPQVAQPKSEIGNGYTSSGSSDSTHSRGSREANGEASGHGKPANGPVYPAAALHALYISLRSQTAARQYSNSTSLPVSGRLCSVQRVHQNSTQQSLLVQVSNMTQLRSRMPESERVLLPWLCPSSSCIAVWIQYANEYIRPTLSCVRS